MPRKVKPVFANDTERNEFLKRLENGETSLTENIKMWKKISKFKAAEEKKMLKALVPVVFNVSLRKPRTRKNKVLSNADNQYNYRLRQQEKGFRRVVMWANEPKRPECAYIPVQIHEVNVGICKHDNSLNSILHKHLELLDNELTASKIQPETMIDILGFFENILGFHAILPD